MKRRPKGSGTVIRTGATWAIRFGSRNASTYESGFRSKAEAEARLTLRRAEVLTARLGPAADPRLTPTLAELAGPWLERRESTHAAIAEDRSRWRLHLAPILGHLRPDEVDTARIRSLVEMKRRTLKPGTLAVVLAVLSSLYEDLLERGLARVNPVRNLPKSLRRLVRSDHDPRTTPFVEKLDDVRRIYLALRELEPSIAVAYAIGAFAGLRTSEVFFLRWPSVDLDGRRILVSEARRGMTKDKDPRPVPIVDSLLPVLQPWRLEHPGTGLVIPPLIDHGDHVDRHTPGPLLARVLRDLGLERPGLGWYEATRHTFASHWAMAGRSLWELQTILGHSSVAVTERYAHLTPGHWAEGVRGTLSVDLSPAGGVAQLPGVPASGATGRSPGRPDRPRRGGSRAARR